MPSRGRVPAFARVASLAVLPTALLAAHCQQPGNCDERGPLVTFSGSEQYVGTLGGDAGAGAGIFGSGPREATIDWYPYYRRFTGYPSGHGCSTSDVPLVVTLGKCTLTGNLTSTSFTPNVRGSPEQFISASASIDAGQTCEISVDGGTATIAIGSGTVQWEDLHTTSIVLSGPVTQWLGSQPASGYLTYTFKGTN
jgi:hypothetical protein